MTDSISRAVDEAAGDVLLLDPADGGDLVREHCDSWDSMAHLELVVRLEEQFGIQFTDQEVVNVRTLQDFVTLIRSKL